MIASAIGPKRILVIEDNPDLAYGLRNNLEIEGYEVEVAKDGTKGLSRARSANPDLVVLDLMLPGMDGFRVLRALREDGHGMPVLILTARGEEADKVRGLRLGADDYVTKPFGVLELLARIEALLRRVVAPKKNGGPPGPPFDKFGDIEVLTPSRTVLRDGSQVALTPKEYDLLLALIRRDGACITRTELLTEVWGLDPARRRLYHAHRAAHGSLGLQRRSDESHRGYARCRAPPQARERSRQPQAHSHRPQNRLPPGEVT